MKNKSQLINSISVDIQFAEGSDYKLDYVKMEEDFRFQANLLLDSEQAYEAYRSFRKRVDPEPGYTDVPVRTK